MGPLAYSGKRNPDLARQLIGPHEAACIQAIVGIFQTSMQVDRSVYTGRQADRQTDRQASRQTDRQTRREAGRRESIQADRRAAGSKPLGQFVIQRVR